MTGEPSVLEVELKFPVSDVAALAKRLADLGWSKHAEEMQSDEYFAHPCRDFVATDEAFRVRTVNGESCLTYKGPRLDAETKTREEIEVGLAMGASSSQQMSRLLASLGFESRDFVRKHRVVGTLEWQGHPVTVSMDAVDELGDYVEIEVLASPAEFASAKQRVLELAETLNLHESERRGYLTLLQEKRAKR